MKLGLREKKSTLTRLGLLDALIARLSKSRLEDISTHDLARDVGISDASFFNYFPAKTDLIGYFIQLWSVEAAWHSRAAASRGASAAIEAIFTTTARRVRRCPRLMLEVTVFQARQSKKGARLAELSLAECLLRFPKLPGVEAFRKVSGFGEVISPALEQAKREGLLPKHANTEATVLAFALIFFGVPLALGPDAGLRLEKTYLTQVGLLCRGLAVHDRVAAHPPVVSRRRTKLEDA